MLTLDFPSGGVAVFGGSGGIGSDICRLFAKAGCDIAFTYFAGTERAERLEKELSSDGIAVSAHRVDVTDNAQVVAAFADMAARHGQIHTVIYASGVCVDMKKAADLAVDRFRFAIEAELFGFFNVVHAAMPSLRAIQGNIVACVSCANRKVIPTDGESAIPKGAIESFIRQIAQEEGGIGVRANAVSVGWINSGQGSLDASVDRSLIGKGAGPEMAEHLKRTVPLGNRPGEGVELAAGVVFLASRQASYITGQNLTIDGGFSL